MEHICKFVAIPKYQLLIFNHHLKIKTEVQISVSTGCLQCSYFCFLNNVFSFFFFCLGATDSGLSITLLICWGVSARLKILKVVVGDKIWAQFKESVPSELILSGTQPLRVFVREQELEQLAR